MKGTERSLRSQEPDARSSNPFFPKRAGWIVTFVSGGPRPGVWLTNESAPWTVSSTPSARHCRVWPRTGLLGKAGLSIPEKTLGPLPTRDKRGAGAVSRRGSPRGRDGKGNHSASVHWSKPRCWRSIVKRRCAVPRVEGAEDVIRTRGVRAGRARQSADSDRRRGCSQNRPPTANHEKEIAPSTDIP